MGIERQPNSFRTDPEKRRPEEFDISIEPKHANSLEEATQENRREFLNLLRDANLRALVRYIQDGEIEIGTVTGIPTPWKEHFGSKEFHKEEYTWINPKLFLLTNKRAAALALNELLRRLRDNLEPQ